MIKERLWTRDFVALVLANGFLFAGFHFLLPTITLYAASLGATGGEIGLIGGIFGYSAICIRLFTDTGVHYLGKKKCLYLGLALSILATVSYYMFDSIHAIVAARILHGFGFGLSTTFAAAIVADVIPASRRGEGIGYFGLGSTVMMALAPAVGLFLLNDISPAALFFSSAAFSFLAVLVSIFCHAGKKVRRVEVTEKASLRDRICETGTGLPAILTIFFGAAYGSVNTYIARCQRRLCRRHARVSLVFDRVVAHHGRSFVDGLAGSLCFLWFRCRPAAPGSADVDPEYGPPGTSQFRQRDLL